MAAVELIGDEPGGGVPSCSQELGQGGAGGVEPAKPLDVQLVRPPRREQTGVRRERPGGRRSGSVESNSLIREPRQVGGRVTAITIETEAVGADRIQHDQEDVWDLTGPKRRAALRQVSGAHVPGNRLAKQEDQDDRQCPCPPVNPGPGAPEAGLDPRGHSQGDPRGQQGRGQGIQSPDQEQQADAG